MKPIKFYFILILCFLLTKIYAQSNGEITKTDCFLDDCDFTEDYPNVEFGYLTVPEDYSKPEGKRLKIAFAVVKSTATKPNKDAIIVFQGGWGLPSLSRSLEGYTKRFPLKDRDVILFDYRGSGHSKPELCSWLGIEGWKDLAANMSNEEFDKRQAERYKKCLDSLELKQIDYNQYGTNNKARDAVILAEAFDYESYNLFGISYGTRGIQNFIRAADSSEIKIRSAILDSNVAIGNNNHSMTQEYVAVLKNIFRDCEDDEHCNKAFPDLESRFIAFLNSLEKEPFKTNYPDNNEFNFNAHEVNAVLHQLLYDSRNYKDIPILIEHFINRESEAFANMLPVFKSRVYDGYNALGAINFIYDWSFLKKEAKIKYQDAEDNYRPFVVTDGYKVFYFTETRIKMDSIENIPVNSDVPALFLAGTYDPITPPEWTKKVADGFTNKFYYEAKKIGHGVVTTRCGLPLMKTFLDNPGQKPDTTCFEALGDNDIQFRTNYYKNDRISYFSGQLISNPNRLLIASLLFVFVLCVANIISFVVSLFKKHSMKRSWFFWSSVLILFFLFGLYYFIKVSAAENQIFILFGLISSANIIMFSVPIIAILGIVAIIKFAKTKRYSILNILSTVAILAFFGIVITYRLLPNI